jgi:hypothetical protein
MIPTLQLPLVTASRRAARRAYASRHITRAEAFFCGLGFGAAFVVLVVAVCNLLTR